MRFFRFLVNSTVRMVTPQWLRSASPILYLINHYIYRSAVLGYASIYRKVCFLRPSRHIASNYSGISDFSNLCRNLYLHIAHVFTLV